MSDIELPKDGTPEMAALMERVNKIQHALRFVKNPISSKDGDWHEWYMADIRAAGFERAVDAEGWLRRLRQAGLNILI